MTERQIRIFGDPVLKTVSAPIETVDDGIRGLVEDLVDSVRTPGRDVELMTGTWAQCPAVAFVPALLRAVWERAAAAPDGPDPVRTATVGAPAEAGADVFVAGSAVYGHESPAERITALRDAGRGAFDTGRIDLRAIHRGIAGTGTTSTGPTGSLEA